MADELVSTVLMEGPGVLEKTVEGDSEEMPYKRLVGKVYYVKYPAEFQQDNHLTIIGATDFWLEMEEISIDKEKGTIEFSAYDGKYLVRPLEDSDSEWASEEDIEEARNGSF